MRWTKLAYFRQSITHNDLTYIVGKDYGTRGNVAYYYIELDGKVTHHGETRLRDAKRMTINLITTGRL